MNTLNLTNVQLEILWNIIDNESKRTSGTEKRIIDAILQKIIATDHVDSIRQKWAAEVE